MKRQQMLQLCRAATTAARKLQRSEAAENARVAEFVAHTLADLAELAAVTQYETRQRCTFAQAQHILAIIDQLYLLCRAAPADVIDLLDPPTTLQ
jgi:hypothetical protein